MYGVHVGQELSFMGSSVPPFFLEFLEFFIDSFIKFHNLQIFPHSFSCLFTSLSVLFEVQKLLS